MPDTGAFTAPPRRQAARSAEPRPLPIDERVFPPRPPDAPRVPLQDSTPLPPAAGARPPGAWSGSTARAAKAWAAGWASGWDGARGRRRPRRRGSRRSAPPWANRSRWNPGTPGSQWTPGAPWQRPQPPPNVATRSRSAVSNTWGRRPRRKSVVLAAVLGFLFGPVGMLYASVKAALAAVITGTAVFVLTLAITLGTTDVGTAVLLAVLQLLMVGPVCAGWAAVAASLRNRALPPA